MRKDDLVRMQHMMDAAKDELAFSHPCSRKSLDTDRKLVLSLVKSIEIIGEAASRVSKETQGAHPAIP